MQQNSILLADSDISYLEMCKDILERHGDTARIDFSKTEAETLLRIAHNAYDIILLNYELNGKNGLNILRQILAIRADLPVVMMIKEGYESLANEAIKNGAYDYIMKVQGHLTALPFTIRKVIERKRINAQATFHKFKQKKSFNIMNGSDAVFIIDRRGRFISANEFLVELIGYTEAELLELTISDLFPQEFENSFYRWFKNRDNASKTNAFQAEIISKSGAKFPIEVFLSALKDADKTIAYHGKIKNTPEKTPHAISSGYQINQVQMIKEIAELINTSSNDPIHLLLHRIAESAAHIFQFRKITLALLDRRKHVFVKQAMIGYSMEKIGDEQYKEVPEKVISKIFSDQKTIKVMYSNRTGIFDYADNGFNENIIFENKAKSHSKSLQWQADDIIIINLVNKSQRTFGYLSLAHPINKHVPNQDTYRNLEIFSKLTSLAIETQYRIYTLEKKNRRLKQILVTSNIFKLHLNFNDLLKEVVWSVKLLLDFNLVALSLVSNRSGMLEIRAVACDDKIKVIQLQDLHFPVRNLSRLLNERFKKSKSYLVDEDNEIFYNFKNIYYGSRNNFSNNGIWKRSTTLLIPIPSRDHKIAGLLIVDDPTDCKMPDKETLGTLELLANQVGVAIDNRIMYVEMKKRLKKNKQYTNKDNSAIHKDLNTELRNWVNKYIG